MPDIFVNDITTTLASTTTTSATAWTVSSSTGWPALSGGNFIRCRIEPAVADGTYEIVTLTAFTGTAWTVTRAQEGTAGVAWASGSKIAPVVTKAVFDLLGVPGQELDLSTEYTTTQPATPATGITLFARAKARRLPAVVGPSGLDTSLQPSLFTNRIARLNVINNTATPSFDGLAVSNVNAPSAVAISTGSFYAMMAKSRYPTLATAANLGGGFRSSSAQWFLSTMTNGGGFFFVARFGIAAVQTGYRGFVGLSATTAALSPSVDPTTLFNLIGFGWNAADSNLRFIQNDGTGTATSVDLGANFSNAAATNFYEVRLFAPSGAGQSVQWCATRLADGAYASGTATSDLPALNTLLAAHFHITNGSVAAVASMDVQSLYIETDN